MASTLPGTMSNNTTAEDALDFVKETVKISVFTPIIYVGILMTAFIAFSINHRKRRLRQLAQIEPLFPENECANLYALVKHMSLQPNLSPLQKPGPAVLKAALLRRAGEAIKRSMKLKEFEGAFEKLYHDGLIGDDIYKQHELQTKVQELELQDIVNEATALKADWVDTFFPVAQEICFNEAMRRRFYAMEERAIELTRQWQVEASTHKIAGLSNTSDSSESSPEPEKPEKDGKLEKTAEKEESDEPKETADPEDSLEKPNQPSKGKADKKKGKKKKAT